MTRKQRARRRREEAARAHPGFRSAPPTPLTFFQAATTARGMLLLVLHVAAAALVLASFYPRQMADLKVIEGPPVVVRGPQGRYQWDRLQVDGHLMNCNPDWLGPSYSCPKPPMMSAPVRATYFEMKTAISVIGLTAPMGVVLKMEQQGQPFFVLDPDDAVDAYFLHGWLLYLVFGTSWFYAVQRLRRKPPSPRRPAAPPTLAG